MVLSYNRKMGIVANGVTLPDPTSWTYQVADLDTSGGRDATGLLHRARVATKVNYEFEWNAIEWEMLQVILGAVTPDKFVFTGPDPRTFNTTYTGNYYVGDRTGSVHYFRPDSQEKAMYNLKLKFIEF